MGKLRALTLIGALAAAAPFLPAAPAGAAVTCAPSGPPIGAVHVSRGIGIDVRATSGSWSCSEGNASVSLTVTPSNLLAALLVDGSVGSAAGTGSVVVRYNIAPTLFTVLLLPPGQCFTAVQTVTGPGGFVRTSTTQGCG